jgi:hypothetical protein
MEGSKKKNNLLEQRQLIRLIPKVTNIEERITFFEVLVL